MKQIVLELQQFRLDAFFNSILKFLKSQVSKDVHPSYVVVKLSEPGGTPEFGPEEGRSEFLAELKKGLMLFFPFSSSNIGDPIACADGKKRKIPERSEFNMGDIDCVGFLLQLKGNFIMINSAIHAGGACPGRTISFGRHNGL